MCVCVSSSKQQVVSYTAGTSPFRSFTALNEQIEFRRAERAETLISRFKSDNSVVRFFGFLNHVKQICHYNFYIKVIFFFFLKQQLALKHLYLLADVLFLSKSRSWL